MNGVARIYILIILAIAVLAGCHDDPVSSSSYEHSASETHDYAISGSASILANTFVGTVTFTEGAVGAVQVTVTRHASVEEHLQLLEVELSQTDSQIFIRASNPEDLKDVAVDVAISGPPNAQLNLAAGVGSVDCTGQPGVLWAAAVGVGNVTFAIPSDTGALLELLTGVGRVDVDFTVTGDVTTRRVVGAIGAGNGKEITANVGAGNITVTAR